MKRTLISGMLILLALCLKDAGNLKAQNPIAAYGGMADPHMYVFNDKVYLFATRDADSTAQTFVMPDWHIWSSDDLRSWTHERTISPTETYMGESTRCWATETAFRNGKYYFYFSNGNTDTGVMTSDSPAGPYRDALGKPLLPEDLTPIKEYDPTVVFDDEGEAYIAFGHHRIYEEDLYFTIARLNEDMISLAEEPREIRFVEDAPYLRGNDKPNIHKRNGVYYLSAGSHYAMADNVYGPYTTTGNSGNDRYGLDPRAHGNYFEWNNQWFHTWCHFHLGKEVARYRQSYISYLHYKDNGEMVTDTGFLDKHFANGVGQYDAGWEKIEAEWYMAASEVEKRESPLGGFEIQSIRNNGSLSFPNFRNLDKFQKISFMLATENDGVIEIRQDSKEGKLLGSCPVSSTGGWEQYRPFTCSLQQTEESTDIYLTFKGESDDILHLDYFNFENESSHIHNPVIPGFNPDPSVCRVGKDYYLVTSTFEYFPGVPVYHSKDLVNWQMMGHVVHRPGQLDYSNISSTAGIYAPTIRYHEGTYYVITTLVGGLRDSLVEEKGNFIMTAKDPAGPWSDPHWIADAPGIDPSLFFDEDGRVYYCGNRHEEDPKYRAERDIWIQEIDLESFTLKGPISVLDSRPYFENDIIGNAVAFEAPHLYRKDGCYYLLIAHGGTGMGHAASIWKSGHPLGPWEMNPANPILTHLGYEQSGINCTGHADIFQTADGEWWTVFLGVRSQDKKNNVMGRETFLSKVDWSGAWPVVNPDGEPGRTAHRIAAPGLLEGGQRSFDFRDDFSEGQLGLDWTFIRNPKTTWWDLTTRPGYMQMKLRPELIEDFSRPSFMGIRVIDMKCEFTASMDFSPEKPGECAGLAFLRGHQPHWSLVKELRGDQARASVYYADSLLSGVDVSGSGELELKITIDDFSLGFFIREDDGDWEKICETDGHELGFPPAGRFTGSFCGLYATSRGDADAINVAAFDCYEMKKVD